MNKDEERADEYATRLVKVADKIPLPMLEDIRIRFGDWALSGSSMGAPYIGNLVANAERMAKMMGANK